jgi:hypothetical protein
MTDLSRSRRCLNAMSRSEGLIRGRNDCVTWHEKELLENHSHINILMLGCSAPNVSTACSISILRQRRCKLYARQKAQCSWSMGADLIQQKTIRPNYASSVTSDASLFLQHSYRVKRSVHASNKSLKTNFTTRQRTLSRVSRLARSGGANAR